MRFLILDGELFFKGEIAQDYRGLTCGVDRYFEHNGRYKIDFREHEKYFRENVSPIITGFIDN